MRGKEDELQKLATQRTSPRKFILHALCYYLRFSGHSRSKAAEYVFGTTDVGALKRIDYGVNEFVRQFYPDAVNGQIRVHQKVL